MAKIFILFSVMFLVTLAASLLYVSLFGMWEINEGEGDDT